MAIKIIRIIVFIGFAMFFVGIFCGALFGQLPPFLKLTLLGLIVMMGAGFSVLFFDVNKK